MDQSNLKWELMHEQSFTTDPALSGHCAVHCETLCLIKSSFEKREVSYPKLRSLDNELLIQDILKSTLMNHGLTDVKSLVNQYLTSTTRRNPEL